MNKPNITEVPEFFQNYIKLVPDGNLLEIYSRQSVELIDFFSELDKEKSLFKYAEGKWTIRELLGHITDTERIFAYRALRIARNDKTPIAGFDENNYTEAAVFNNKQYDFLIEQFINIRKTNMDLFSSFEKNDFDKEGIIEGNQISIRAIISILIGHAEHHKTVINKRYL